MKKKIWIPILIVAVLAILAVPIPTQVAKDGGTREYSALTYKIVAWNRADISYHKTKVYFFPDNFKSLDELWQYEKETMEHSFIATILEINDTSVVVQPVDDASAHLNCDMLSFGTDALDKIDAEVGSVVKVTYKGPVMESYPAQIHATGWELSDELRYTEYPGEWLDKSTSSKQQDSAFGDIMITEIYSDCFFADPLIPMPYRIKINGKLSDEWCVGDKVSCTCENTYYDSTMERIETDMLSIEASDWDPDPDVCYKPVIYLYPEEEMKVDVRLAVDGMLTCTYPSYDNGWSVTASPDGTLVGDDGQTYNYLYWEGETQAQFDLSKGFCVKGEETAAFLEDSLARLGLDRREANEFIVFWLPMMEQNPYNIISFQTDAYTDAARLTIDPAPDTLIRVFMAWQKSDSFVEIPGQALSAPERNGFTAVEWGGTEVK